LINKKSTNFSTGRVNDRFVLNLLPNSTIFLKHPVYLLYYRGWISDFPCRAKETGKNQSFWLLYGHCTWSL